MKRFVVSLVTFGGAFALSAQDAEGRPGLTEEQANARQAIVEQHDADGDGLLSRQERKGLTKEEKKALAKTGGVGTARKAPTLADAKASEGDGKAEANRRDEAKQDGENAAKGNAQRGKGGGKK